MKVLIADDSPTMRRIVKDVLIKNGISEADIIEASDGEEALSLWQTSNGIALLLLDWNMPKMNGLDTLHIIRDVDKTTPIVMLTTRTEKNDIVSAIAEGASNYILKPFEEETLVKKLKPFIKLKD